MVESLIEWLKDIPEELVIFLISMLPILELRGGLIAASLLGVEWAVAFPICIIGNALPIPFVLFFFNKIIAWLKTTKLFGKFATKMEDRAKQKGKKIESAKFLGLMLFVGIPLPGTGGWTGAAAAALLNMRVKKSAPPIFLGILLAGVIMSVLAYFVPGLFGFAF